MSEQQLAHPGRRRRRQQPPGCQIVVNFAKDPGPPLGRAADHQAIGTRVLQHLRSLVRRVDVAVGDHRDAHGLLDGADGVVFGSAGVTAGAGAAVHRQGLDTGPLGELRDVHAVAVVRIPAGADLQGNRDSDSRHHRLEYAADQDLVAQQRGTGRHLADLARRAAHVDIDDGRAMRHVDLRGPRHGGRIRTQDLYRHRGRFPRMVEPPHGLARGPQAGVRGHHFGYGKGRAQTAAELTERAIRNPGHRGNEQIVLKL